MISLSQVIVVEGKYDKNKIKQIFDAAVIDTQGFGIFNDREKLMLLRTLARERGLIVLTDSDSGGLLIRNFFKSAVQNGRVWHAYVPDIRGKERRKRESGKEGLLGVEGIEDAIIIEAVRRSGAMEGQTCSRSHGNITKADLYELGLSGRDDSANRRKALCAKLGLPKNLSSTALLDVLNMLTDIDSLRLMNIR